MLDLATAVRVIDSEWATTLGRLDALSDAEWRRPTRLEGWQVRDLAAHFVYGTSLEADALRRMSRRESAPAESLTMDPGRPRAEVLEAVHRHAADLRHVIAGVEPERMADGICPMPYGPVPLGLALQIFTMEAGVHGNDLAWAVDGQPPLTPEVCLATAVTLSVSWPAFASASALTPPEGLGLRVLGAPVPVHARHRAGAWQFEDDGGPWTATIRGDAGAAILFEMGRIPYDDQRLTVEGDREAAARFKGYFPGP